MSDDELRFDLPLASDEADDYMADLEEAIRESQEELDAANAMMEWIQGLRP
jgi:hypothetical protein